MFDNFIERSSKYLMNAIKDLLFMKGHDVVTDKFLTLINLKSAGRYCNNIITTSSVDLWFHLKGINVLRPANPKVDVVYYYKFDKMNYAAKITVFVYKRQIVQSSDCELLSSEYEKVTFVKPIDYLSNSRWNSVSFFCILGPDHKKYGKTIIDEINEYNTTIHTDNNLSEDYAAYSGYNDISAEIKNLDDTVIGLCHSIGIKYLPWYDKILDTIDFEICNLDEYRKLGFPRISRTLIVGDHGVGKSKLCEAIACYYAITLILLQDAGERIYISSNEAALLDDFDIALERNIQYLNKVISNNEESIILATCTDIEQIPPNVMSKFTNVIYIEGLDRKESEKIADFYKLPHYVLDIINFEERIPIAIIQKYLLNMRIKYFKLKNIEKEATCVLEPILRSSNVFQPNMHNILSNIQIYRMPIIPINGGQ